MEKHAHCTVAILTVSDRCTQNIYEDKTGALLKTLVEQPPSEPETLFAVTAYQVVPDERKIIADIIAKWSDARVADVILTNGGTGYTQRDVTPEATADVIEFAVQSIPAVIAAKCYPLSLYSRQVAGIRKRTLVVNLPGSTKGARECFEILQPALKHICQQLREETRDIRAFHKEEVQKNAGSNAAGEEGERTAKQSHTCSHHHSASVSRVDISNIAGRCRKSPFPMITVQEALDSVLKHAVPMTNSDHVVEQVVLANALSRICAQDLFARDPLLPFPASIKDGYAVLASDGPGVRRVIGDSAAVVGACNIPRSSCTGDSQLGGHGVFAPGTCIRVNTGAPIPHGADAVVQVEDTRVVRTDDADGGKTELEIEILSTPKVGQDIRPTGSDIAVDTRILLKHQQISPWDIGMLATCGIIRVPVFRRPRIALLSTGNELVAPDCEQLPPGCIRDANKASLRALLTSHGFDDKLVFDAGVARDTPTDTLKVFRHALENADVIISTGGVSMGDRDVIKQVLQQDLSATIHFAQVKMKPGKPTTFATCEFGDCKKLIFALPGNPVSALVTAHLYVLPALRKLSGQLNYVARTIRCVSNERLQLDVRPEYHRAMLVGLDEKSGLPLANSTGQQISSRLLSFAGADVLLILPAAESEQRQCVEAGEPIDAMML